ncbi:CLUMA_CG016043, isoform A [Clunio marinus]|uniref:CLUMA_CG016043, isoform A n=1 Tax=Clunio marinus TaxID=568069 RepID=A0A1J1IRH8_9DIPT|nr:CLUMA_CG016043, isoform A [Clunio marinus]
MEWKIEKKLSRCMHYELDVTNVLLVTVKAEESILNQHSDHVSSFPIRSPIHFFYGLTSISILAQKHVLSTECKAKKGSLLNIILISAESPTLEKIFFLLELSKLSCPKETKKKLNHALATEVANVKSFLRVNLFPFSSCSACWSHSDAFPTQHINED